MKGSDSKGTIIAAVISGIFVVVAATISGFFLLESSRIKEASGATATAMAQITPPSLSTLTPAPTYTPLATYTSYPTQIAYPLPTQIPVTPTLTPMGMASQVFQVNGDTAFQHDESRTDLYIALGDKVQINYLSGQWYIANSEQKAQTPTDANGYVNRDGDRVTAQLSTLLTDPNICHPLLSAPFGSLIGQIGASGGLFYIGNSLEFTPQDSGILYLRINYGNTTEHPDWCPPGGGGSISVHVSITPP